MKFIVTKELGRLVRWLRILGFDAEYFQETNRSSLVITSLRDERIILTRDSRMSPVSGIRILRVKHDELENQLAQVTKELGIKLDEKRLFTRCILCNRELEPAEKETIKDKVPEYVYEAQKGFLTCPSCGRVYWHGTHWGNVRKLLVKVGLR